MELRLPIFLRTLSCIVVLVSVFVSVRGASNTLFPYGPATNDKSVGQIGHADTVVVLPLPVKFAGQSFTSSNILKDGMLSFEPGVRFVEWTWREGTPNPAIDRPFIAPFHYDGFVPLQNPDAYRGKIYYKLTTRARNDMDTTEDDRQFMNMLDQYVMDASVALKTGFTSQFVLKVTWENVSSARNCSDQVMLTGCPSNTFQVLLIGDGDHTFVIFNYFKMEIPFSSHQLAGLNGGHGRGWTDVVPCTGACAKRSKLNPSRISTLVSRAGSDVEGRYILMVNGDVIIRGGCIPDGLKSGNIAVYPRETGMFGGEMLAVSGNCHPAGTKIYCRFGRDDQYRSEGVMETSMRGRCPVPVLTTRGQVELEISIDNMAWKHRTKLNIILPSRMDWPIDVSSFSTPWYQTSPKELRVRWTSHLFSSHYAATLEVNLIGYREDEYNNETPLIMRNLVQLATGISNRNEEVVINPSQFPCTSECDDFEIGLVQLRVAEQYVDNTTKYKSVNFGPVALGWYVNNAMTQSYGQNWPEAKCKAWSEKDRLTSGWLDHLLSCPCTLSQALADWGRWQPDMGCNMFTGSECYYHVDALHCVRSVHPS
ncbi:protein mesh-like, partial [Littorina saxatilis]|uniref:AMOP domain-containing protein n=1 Tax=Littorina saxatilis TaxID=31220 RepID=A0AAN9FZQ3_9CAEN